MSYKKLSDFIIKLEDNNELIRIKEFVNPTLEITEIADRISKSNNNKAILFENTGTNFPLLINAFGSEKRIKLALNIDNFNDIEDRINYFFNELTSAKTNLWEQLMLLPTLKKIGSFLPKNKRGKGDCQEVIVNNPDLNAFPILKCWPNDGGNFITLPIVHTIDPETKTRNVGMYRMQVFDSKTTGMHWHLHKGSAQHYDKYKEKNIKMPIAVALGGDPILTYIATAPLPDGIDEYIFAGFLRNKNIELVKCITQDIYVPDCADIIIEGYIDPSEELIWEGPFGDHTGYYSLADYYPKFHVTCITHKKNAIYPATIVGIPPMEDAWIGKATEKLFLPLIKKSFLPEIIDLNLPFAGVAHNIVILKIKTKYPGHAQKVMNSILGTGQMMFTKILIIINEDVDINNYEEVFRIILKNVYIKRDVLFFKGPTDALDHSSQEKYYGGKMCIDATLKSIINENVSTNAFEKINLNDVIIDVNYNLINNGTGVLIVSINKEKIKNIKEVIDCFASKNKDLRAIILMDNCVDISNIFNVIWQLAGNIDPTRDSYIIENTIVLDGTVKTAIHDNFNRDWPNVVTMDKDTINIIDNKWATLNIGDFIESPSLQKLNQIFNNSAVY